MSQAWTWRSSVSGILSMPVESTINSSLNGSGKDRLSGGNDNCNEWMIGALHGCGAKKSNPKGYLPANLSPLPCVFAQSNAHLTPANCRNQEEQTYGLGCVEGTPMPEDLLGMISLVHGN
jgi:hypothetical protein